jgi:hypothetical protein
MNSYSVSNCTYDGTSGDPNPRVFLSGTVNGVRSGTWILTWATIQQPLAVGGQAALQAVLGPILLGVFGPPFPRGPVYSAQISPPPAANANNTNVSIPQALMSWSA